MQNDVKINHACAKVAILQRMKIYCMKMPPRKAILNTYLSYAFPNATGLLDRLIGQAISEFDLKHSFIVKIEDLFP